MKKSIYILLLLAAACRSSNHDGSYVAHIKGQYAMVDDTIIVVDTVITNKTGYQKIRNGQMWPKAYKTKQWTLNSPDAPVIQINGDKIILGQTLYTKLP